MKAETQLLTCAVCEVVFPKDPAWESKAVEEALALWGVPDADHDPNMEIVCGECFRRMQEERPDLFEWGES